VATNFYSSWDECPTNLWTLPAYSEFSNMTQDNLTTPVAAAATTQVKLCPYDEEDPHIWFRLIEAQFAAAGIRSKKLKYANARASLPKQVLRDILDTLDVCNESMLRKFGKRKWQSYF
jgi:ABC-type Zn uptake system ZnuABC Zn-binding protein ZnuA